MYIKNFLKLLFFTLCRKTIIINESSGLGDYIWIRNYFRLLKKDKNYCKHKIIYLATKNNKEFIEKYDSETIDLILYFKNPYNPKPKELFLLKLFKFDIFINARSYHPFWQKITNTVKARKVINRDIKTNSLFYNEWNNKLFSQLIDIDKNFVHTLPCDYKPKHTIKDNYIIITPSGNSVGSISIKLLEALVKTITNISDYKILILGTKKDKANFEKIIKYNTSKIIDGFGCYKTFELPYIIKHCKLLLSIDTSILNMAIQLDRPIICLATEKTIKANFKNIEYIQTNASLANLNIEEVEKILIKKIESL